MLASRFDTLSITTHAGTATRTGQPNKPSRLRKARLAVSLAVVASSVLSGCSRYQMTLNETVVYNPPSLLTDFDTVDPRLKSCLDQAIKDLNATDFGQVTQLICSHAGVSDLQGIEAFYNLKQVNLENNQIRSLRPLQYLSKLEVLKVNDNQLQQAPEILTLPTLQRVDLQNNPQLACGDIEQFAKSRDSQIERPEQCR